MAEGGAAGPGDSYIGSLISLTSKSEIRYEGLLYTVDAENSNIALQNVRSFGTEGRKKNGPQVPASDKVYEFIIFRGTDIKDLQVKVSPPQPIHSDPAIISLQAQVSQPAAVPPYMSPPVADPFGNRSTYKANSVPYYHAASSGMPLWAPPPPQVPSGSMPYYWQGFYRPQDEHRLLEPLAGPDVAPRSTRGLPAAVTSAAQSVSLNTGPSQTSALQALTTSDFTQFPPSSTTTSHIETVNPARVDVGTSISATNTQPYSSSLTSPKNSGILQEKNGVDVPLLKPKIAKEIPFREILNGGSHGVSKTSSSPVAQVSRKVSGKSHQVYKQVYRQVQVTKDDTSAVHQGAPPKLQPKSAQPLLPLPNSPAQGRPFIQNGLSKSKAMRRGGGKVGNMGRPSKNTPSKIKVLEDFDFMAMNEKFNKEEVWGELLKVECKDRLTEENDAMQGTDYSFEAKDQKKDFDGVSSDLSKKVVYVKDDFFDSLSCGALDREQGRQERLKFSEQRRIDTETFGSYHLRGYRGGGAFRGRHGGGGHGQSRGGARARGGYGHRGIRG